MPEDGAIAAPRRRPAARLLLTDGQGRVLLLRFEHRGGALDGLSYWATPGGGVEAGESYAAAALRELFEETGIVLDGEAALGPVVEAREQLFMIDSGEQVCDDERYFHVRVDGAAISRAGWTDYERSVMRGHRWCAPAELAAMAAAGEAIWPADLAQLLAQV